MKLLGIDYGKRKIGIAVADGNLSKPLKVIRINSFLDAADKIKRLVADLGIEKIVVGISEGKMSKECIEFAKLLGADTFDETLSTQDAQNLSILAGIKRKKRRNMEDAYAASIILQGYIDSNELLV